MKAASATHAGKDRITDSQSPPASIPDSTPDATVMLQNELAVQKDDYLRLAADFDNFKKRTRRDSGQKAAAEKESFSPGDPASAYRSGHRKSDRADAKGENPRRR